jgi:hypothetical protein
MDFQELGMGGMDCVGVAEDVGRWWVLVNAVMNFRGPKIRGIF